MLFSRNEMHLISRALEGCERAWLKLVRQHESRVYNYSYRLTGNRADALDLTQEVFLSVYRALPNYEVQGAFNAWILKMATRRAVDFLRSQNRNPLAAKDDNCDPDALLSNDAPDKHTFRLRDNKSIINMLSELDYEQRLVIELKCFQHLKFEEIALHLELSPNTVKSRYYAALKKMRSMNEVKYAIG